jgi:phospholipase D1/2
MYMVLSSVANVALTQIYAFCMQLWAEHLWLLKDLFRDPEMLECVLRVNVMAQANWDEYMPEEVINMKGTSHAISL